MIPRAYFTGQVLIVLLFVAGAAAQESPEPPALSLDAALAQARAWDYGDDPAPLEYLRERVLAAQGDPVSRDDLASALAGLLSDESRTYAGKVFACRQLYLIGGTEQAGALIAWLGDPEVGTAARYALEKIPGAEINDAIWAALESAEGPAAAGLTGTLAARGGRDAITRLVLLLAREDPDTVRAAIAGLGRIGGPEAETALREAATSLPDTLRPAAYDALLACAEWYAARDRVLDADRLYSKLLTTERPLPVRLGAFAGRARLLEDDAAPMIAEAYLSAEPVWMAAARGAIRNAGGAPSTARFVSLLAAVPPEAQVPLLGALADRGDPAALDVVAGGLRSDNEDVRLATIDALGALGNETVVPALLAIAAGADKEAGDRARSSLARLPDAGSNGALLRAFNEATPEQKALISSLLAARQAVEAVPILLDTVAYETDEVRRGAWEAVGALARADALPRMVALFFEAREEESRSEGGRALLHVLRRIPATGARADTLHDVFRAAPDPDARASLLAIVAELGDDRLLSLVRDAVRSPEAPVREAAVRALCGWRTPAPREAVYAIAADESDSDRRHAALEGFIRMLRLDTGAPVDDRVAGFERALALSDTPGIKRAVLAGLGELRSSAALDLAERLRANAEVRAEANVAALAIRRQFFRATASAAADEARRAADGRTDTFWQVPGGQTPGQWIEIDLYRSIALRGIVLDTARTPDAFPRGFRVYLYEAGAPPGEPVAEGVGAPGVTPIDFARPFSGRMLRIEQTADAPESDWVIHEIGLIPE
ncbi:MAG: HEAT repeat domain-containing protein [Candidatus Hydrogenedentes bacterium]|nr:HEAT repeat domain-containing protein [Candidatus Hydrogenedentota bacterium]